MGVAPKNPDTWLSAPTRPRILNTVYIPRQIRKIDIPVNNLMPIKVPQFGAHALPATAPVYAQNVRMMIHLRP
jgi:hypothetical protein